jgi:uncharacterized protein
MRSADRSAARAAAMLAPLLLASLLLAAALADGPPAQAQQSAPEPLSAFPQSLLSVRTASGRVINFKVWIADNERRSEQGLMFVRDIDDHAGMLFPFSGAESTAMWMKNTYLPLDMLFVDGRGRITDIARHTTPLSLDLIALPAGTRAVIELKGDSCDRFGIAVGDHVLSDALPHER